MNFCYRTLMQFKIFTLFPEMFPGTLDFSIASEARQKGVWSYKTINIRDFGLTRHKNVDDTPYGGGAGMVIRADVLGAALESSPIKPLIYLSPRGKQLTQAKVAELAKQPELGIICGRFEGVDQRVLTHYNIEEISIGDYILSGGEPAALVLMDSIIRVLPEVVGNAETHSEESFSNGLLEYPHYTRPAQWNGLKVPEVLTSGNHAEIAKWRHEQSVEITKKNRPDLLN
jgi:tRNA (guanine37-N1)-methyltransferase